MDAKKLRKGCLIALAVYIVLVFLFYWIAGEQLKYTDTGSQAIDPLAPVGELVQGTEIRQPVCPEGDEWLDVSMLVSTFGRENDCTLSVAVEDADGAVLARKDTPCAGLNDGEILRVEFDTPPAIERGRTYYLVLTSPDAESGNAVSVWYGNSRSAARADIALSLTEEEKLTVNGQSVEGLLHYTVTTRDHSWFGQNYWYCALGFGLAAAGYCVWLMQACKKGKDTAAFVVVRVCQRYRFLLKQLVARDFKAKYKRSILGIFWSFLNPLLTMLVQYIVFSTLFRSDIDHFAMYLLCGIVCFSFFSEATSMALQSIVGNANLITKVYVPKYIYPLARVLSSSVNLLLSLIPLFIAMLITGLWPRPAILLLPFGIVCLVMFSLGVSLFLASMMVFFRDTQFLWGVISMLWMYLTPIFYPDSIIPARFMTLYKCNPLYHIIRFVRTVLISGVSPEPRVYGLCLLASVIPLILGVWVFRKTQDKFIMNL